jgi:hypothetical protein
VALPVHIRSIGGEDDTSSMKEDGTSDESPSEEAGASDKHAARRL